MNSLNFIFVPFNFMYFLFCSPFRIILQTNSKDCKIHVHKKTCWLQKVLCGIFTFLDILWTIYRIRISVRIDSLNNPRLYIGIFGIFVSQIGKLIFFTKLWMSPNEFLRLPKLVARMYTTRALEDNKTTTFNGSSYLISFVISAFYLSIAVINMGRIYGQNSPYEIGSTSWWSDLVNVGKAVLFVGTEANVNATIQTYVLSADTLVGVLAGIGLQHRFTLELIFLKLFIHFFFEV